MRADHAFLANPIVPLNGCHNWVIEIYIVVFEAIEALMYCIVIALFLLDASCHKVKAVDLAAPTLVARVHLVNYR